MAYERLQDNIVYTPAPFDVHMHPRVTDAITEDAFIEINGGYEGKAGLKVYTAGALNSGIGGGLVMPNEIMRRYAPQLKEKTKTQPFPISNYDRVLMMQNAIEQHSYIPLGVIFGVDPQEIYDKPKTFEDVQLDIVDQHFHEVRDDIMALKLYGDETTGGYNVSPDHIAPIVDRWRAHNPDKPTILHVEGGNVAKVLTDIEQLDNGSEIPIHIAHVSSRKELSAVIEAKKRKMNVTCEVTVHHLFLDESVNGMLSGVGCSAHDLGDLQATKRAVMKPSLKGRDDVLFLQKNISSIDIFASDCAPHRPSDKQGENPAYGVTNHSIMLPLLHGAVREGWLSYEDIDQKFCIKPRERFNIPLDNSRITVAFNLFDPQFKADKSVDVARIYDGKVAYGENPFTRIEIASPMIGHLLTARAGQSYVRHIEPNAPVLDLIESRSHIITPLTAPYISGN